MKALSAVLAVVAVIGLVASGMTVNDVLGAKSYWEQKSIESDENLAKLEDGLNQLQENEQAYLDGREELADGKAEYAEGQQTLEQGYADYAQGQQDYKDGKKEYADGKALLESKTAAFEEGKVLKVQAKQAYDAVKELEDGYSHEKAVATVAAKVGMSIETIEKAYKNGNDDAYTANLATIDATENLLKQPKSVEVAAGFVAQSIEKDPAVVLKAYKNVKALVDGVTLEQAAMMASATKGGTEAEQAARAGSIADAYKAIGAIVAGQPYAVIEANYGYAEEAIKGIYDGVNNYVKTAKEGGSTATDEELVSAGVDYILTTMAEPKPQKEQLLQLYGAVKQLLNLAGSEEGAIQFIASTKPEDPSDISNAYYGVKNMLASKDNPTLAATVVANSVGEKPEDIKALYDNVNDLMAGYSAERAAATVAPKREELEQARTAYQGVYALEKGYSHEDAVATVAGATGMDKATVELGYANGSPQGQRAIQAQLDEYTNGQAKLRAAKVELDAAPGKLADAEKQLAEGEAKLADAAKQIAEGEEKLAEFEDGAAEAKDGIQQVVDTEPDGWLASIASRLPEDFGYEKENGDLEIAKGFEAIAAARDYKKDSGAAIETELYGRIYGIVAVAIASILALIAAVLGFTKKYKGAIPCAALAAVAGGVATFLTGKAGTVFSVIAGSTLGSLAMVAGIALAVVAIVHAVASGSAAKAN